MLTLAIWILKADMHCFFQKYFMHKTPYIVCLASANCKLTLCDIEVHFKGTNIYVIGQVNFLSSIYKNLYWFDVDVESMNCHGRLGHIRQDTMLRLAKNEQICLLAEMNMPHCDHYLANKVRSDLFGRAKRGSAPLDLIRSDIWDS